MTCNLCRNEKKLLESHIIPKFVFKWLKKTGSSYQRNPAKPNVRIQDGIKERLLCFECEQKLSLSEKWFAENIFNNFLSGTDNLFSYGEELGKFVVSLLWRIAVVSKDNLNGKGLLLQEHLRVATEEWRKYLDSGIKPEVYDDLHLLLLPHDAWAGKQPNRFVSRYFSRDTDGHIITIGDECWVYIKFARFMFFGRISGDKPTFRGSKVQLDYGTTLPTQFIDLPELTDYLIDRARNIYEYAGSVLSKKQHAVIQQYFEKDAERIRTVDLGKRLREDSSAEIVQFVHDRAFKYICDCCFRPMREPEGYMLRTFEILLSANYFKNLFAGLGLSTSKDDLDIRIEYFKALSAHDSPWVICEECIAMFEVDLLMAKGFIKEWIQSRGRYIPPKSQNFHEHLTETQKKEIAQIIVAV